MLKCKRVDDVLLAAKHAYDSGAKNLLVTIVGDGSQSEFLKQLAATMSIRFEVDFKGFVDNQEIAKLMQTSDAYIFPSDTTEGWGMVVNEAMSMGLPIICYRASGASYSLLNHDVNSLVADKLDYKLIGNFIVDLYNSEELRYRLSLEAYKTITEIWSPRVAAERLFKHSSLKSNFDDSNAYKSGPLS